MRESWLLVAELCVDEVLQRFCDYLGRTRFSGEMSDDHTDEASILSDVVDASFEFQLPMCCTHCGAECSSILTPIRCPYQPEEASMTDSRTMDSTIEQVLAVEDNLPSYYEHLSLSILAPQTQEEPVSPRRKCLPRGPALPLPEHMTPLGEYLEGVVAYVEVRSNLGDHSGSIGALLYRMGASIVSSLCASVTHAVLCSARPSSIQKAESMRSVRVVAARWVLACKEQMRRVSEDEYPMVEIVEKEKRLRLYRYKTSGVNDKPSPVSVRNLALLSRARRGVGFSSDSEIDSPSKSPTARNVMSSPRKSLRRMLFRRAKPLDLDSETEPESIPDSQDISLEIPETQPSISAWVPETEEQADRCDSSDISLVEIPETQEMLSRSLMESEGNLIPSATNSSICCEKQTVLEKRRSSCKMLPYSEEVDELEGNLSGLHLSVDFDEQIRLRLRATRLSSEISLKEDTPEESCPPDSVSLNEGVVGSLELRLPEGTSQSPESSETEDTCQTSPKRSTSFGSRTSKAGGKSEEIGMNLSSILRCEDKENTRGQGPHSQDSFNFTLLSSNTILTDPKTRNKQPTDGNKENLRTPLNRMHAHPRSRLRYSDGIFSDDTSPCTNVRRNIVLSAVGKEKSAIADKLQKLSGSLRNGYTIAKHVNARTDIVVLGRRKRTVSVLLGMSWGCWFVTLEWAERSIEAGEWLDPTSFEVTDYLDPMVTNRLLRTDHASKTRQFLVGISVFITRRHKLQLPPSVFQRMAIQAGAKIVFDPKKADVYIGNAKSAQKLHCNHVRSQWLIECISTGKLLPYDDFAL